MLVNIYDDRLNGQGSQLYSVSIQDNDGDMLGTALWLADDDDDLEHQLFLDFIGDDTDLELARTHYNVDIRPGYLIECIGKADPNGQ